MSPTGAESVVQIVLNGKDEIAPVFIGHGRGDDKLDLTGLSSDIQVFLFGPQHEAPIEKLSLWSLRRKFSMPLGSRKRAFR